jgi:S1-C subfamily serine protease
MAAGAEAGTGGALLGYPENGSFQAKPARLGTTSEFRTDNIYGEEVERLVDVMRANVEHGNSGGPLVSEDGDVLTTVFASAVNSETGGYGTPNSVVLKILDEAGDEAVDTGPCLH